MPAEEFRSRDLRGSSFRECDLSDVVMRAVDVAGMEIDAPWLFDDSADHLLVNGVDVRPYVDAELDRRFPGRELRHADNPHELRRAWAAVERTWAETTARVERMPRSARDASVGDEWSFAQTLRHLVMATDTWFGKAVLRREDPYHSIGQPHAEYETDGYDIAVFSTTDPPYDEVLVVRAERQAMVREFIASADAELLAQARPHPWGPDHEVSVARCLRVILNEEWEHHRYAVRDLDALEAGG